MPSAADGVTMPPPLAPNALQLQQLESEGGDSSTNNTNIRPEDDDDQASVSSGFSESHYADLQNQYGENVTINYLTLSGFSLIGAGAYSTGATATLLCLGCLHADVCVLRT